MIIFVKGILTIFMTRKVQIYVYKHKISLDYINMHGNYVHVSNMQDYLHVRAKLKFNYTTYIRMYKLLRDENFLDDQNL